MSLDEPLQAAPARFGPYRVIGRIARGASGTILKAIRDDGVYEQTVAIKLLEPGSGNAVTRARLIREREILARLEHPDIVRMLDGGEAAGQPWLATEFVEGIPILDAADRARLPLDARIALFLRLCDAVAFAHRHLIVHGELVAPNVLLTAGHDLRILDFGAAPDTAEIGGDDAPGIAEDVSALGALLRDLVVSPRLGTARAKLLGPSRRDELKAIAAKAMHPDPAHRYIDVAALRSDLERFRNHAPVTAIARPGPFYRARRFLLRHRTGAIATVSVIAALATVTAISTVQYARAERARAEADRHFEQVRGTASYLLDGLTPQLENTPGALPFRIQVADVAQQYLDRLAQARQTSAVVRQEAASGLVTLAEMQAKWNHPNIGRAGPALANLAHALALVDALPDAARATMELRIHIDQMWILLLQKADLTEAMRVAASAARTLARAHDISPQLRADYWAALAELEGWRNRYDAQERAARQGLRAIGEDASRDAVLLHTLLLSELGDAVFYAHSAGRDNDRKLMKGSLGYYQRSNTLLEAAVRQWPADHLIRAKLAHSWWEIGTTHLEFDEFAPALAALDKAATGADTVYAFDRADESNRHLRHMISGSRAQTLAYVGRVDDGLAILNGLVAEDEAAVRREPNDKYDARQLLFEHGMIGEMLDVAGRHAEACRVEAETLATYRQLQAAHIGLPRDSFDALGWEQRLRKNCGR
jgi:serine/threonine-protein kinase